MELLPGITFIAGDSLHWSPENQTITFRASSSDPENLWGLIHECGHAKLQHESYASDMELLQLEVAAWDEAERLAVSIDENIDTEHIQDCLDTYRDWLHQRSTCPRCGVVTFQENPNTYHCFNCNKAWIVSSSRFCRPYRLGAEELKNRPKPKPQTVFE